MTKSTSEKPTLPKRQPLGQKSVEILTLLRDRGPMTMRELRDCLPHISPMFIGATLRNMATGGYTESEYIGLVSFGAGKIHKHFLTDAGKDRLEMQAHFPVRVDHEHELWIPNSRRRIGDMGGIKTPSIWAYAAQVGA